MQREKKSKGKKTLGKQGFCDVFFFFFVGGGGVLGKQQQQEQQQ